MVEVDGTASASTLNEVIRQVVTLAQVNLDSTPELRAILRSPICSPIDNLDLRVIPALTWQRCHA